MRQRQIALPIEIAGVGLYQALSNGKTVIEGFQRIGGLAFRQKHVTKFVVSAWL
jgi:hypothetical protein